MNQNLNMIKKCALGLAALGVFSFPAHADCGDTGILAGMTCAPELSGDGYDRDDATWNWRDFDRDGQKTHHEVMAAESLVPVTWSDNGKSVVKGLWYDPYTGKTFTSPKRADGYAQLQVDHVVPLKEAWRSGAANWDEDKLRKYTNYEEHSGHLIAVDGRTNGSKSDKDPADWVPKNATFICSYIHLWVSIKREWELSIDPDEKAAIVNYHREYCE